MADSEPSLDGIPPELRGLIIDHLWQPSWLAALCLASKKLCNEARPWLYKRVTITDNTPETVLEPGRSLLAAQNPGLKHIRHLEIKSAHHGLRFLHRFLHILPRNILHSLDVSYINLDEAAFVAVITQQQSLRAFGGGLLQSDCAPFLRSEFLGEGINIWANLTSLIVSGRAQSKADLEVYNLIIRSAPQLRELIIRAKEFDDDSDEQVDEKGGGILLPTLFKHDAQKGPDGRLSLTKLSLDSISLYDTKQLANNINLAKLQRLCLFRCPHTAALLNELTHIANTDHLSLRELQVEMPYETDQCGEELFELLCSFSGLRSLVIIANNNLAGFDTGCLSGHQATLERLVFALPWLCECRPYNVALVLPLVRFAKSCMQLEELGLPLPLVRIDDDVSSKTYKRFESTLLSLVSLPKLQALRIMNVPKAPEDSFDYNQRGQGLHAEYEQISLCNIALYEPFLDDFASDLFQRLEPQLGHRKLPVISFGGCYAYEACDGDEHQNGIKTVYIQGTRPVQYGPAEMCAIRLPLAEAQERWPDRCVFRID